MENPTIVVISDRNDLDGQLFGVFSLAQDLLREEPVQVGTRQDLRKLLANRPFGGIVFATIKKLMPCDDEDVFPELSDRHNFVVIADEAHRIQYGFEAKLKGRLGHEMNQVGYPRRPGRRKAPGQPLLTVALRGKLRQSVSTDAAATHRSGSAAESAGG
jgi:type I restriction enzyme R subunit